MPLFTPDQIDPETIRITVDAPFLENLQALTQQAIEKARFGKKVALIHHYRQDLYETLPEDAPADAAPSIVGYQDWVGFRDYEPDFFEKGEYQCPRDADGQWENEHGGKPRPFPSIMVTADPRDPDSGRVEIVVSKPSLCDSCVHGLSRKIAGHCIGLRFESLPTLRDPH